MGARGPKPGEYGEGREKAFAVRLSPEELVRYKRIAKRAGMSLGAWIRRAMESAAESKKS